MSKPETPQPKLAITLTFWRKFGAPHWHKYSDEKNDVRPHVDQNLRGRTIVFIPTDKRREFEIGRSDECWIRIGFNPESKRDPDIPADVMDDGGAMAQPLFNHLSRKHVTFAIVKDDWVIYPGGEFWNTTTGAREWGETKNRVYLNGHQLPEGKNSAPLFPPGSNMAKVQLGDLGKIIIVKGRIGSHTTSWPDEIWHGEGWPDMVAIARARVAKARADVALAQEALTDSGLRKESLKPQSTAQNWQSELIRMIERTPNDRLALLAAIALLGVYIWVKHN